MFKPDVEGTQVIQAASIQEIRVLLEAGMSVADAVIPYTEPEQSVQLELFPP